MAEKHPERIKPIDLVPNLSPLDLVSVDIGNVLTQGPVGGLSVRF